MTTPDPARQLEPVEALAPAAPLTARVPIACPECGAHSLGNRRGACTRCNRFAQRVRRDAARLLAAWHPYDADLARLAAEARAFADAAAELRAETTDTDETTDPADETRTP